METKKRENKNTRPIRANTGKGVERLEMDFGDKNMTLNSPAALGKRRDILCMTCTN